MISKYESKAKKELREDGWMVDWKIRPTRPTRGYTVDYFNKFDIIAYKKGKPLRFISIKGHAGIPGGHRRELENDFSPGKVQKEIWVYRKDKPVDKIIL